MYKFSLLACFVCLAHPIFKLIFNEKISHESPDCSFHFKTGNLDTPRADICNALTLASFNS